MNMCHHYLMSTMNYLNWVERDLDGYMLHRAMLIELEGKVGYQVHPSE